MNPMILAMLALGLGADVPDPVTVHSRRRSILDGPDGPRREPSPPALREPSKAEIARAAKMARRANRPGSRCDGPHGRGR